MVSRPTLGHCRVLVERHRRAVGDEVVAFEPVLARTTASIDSERTLSTKRAVRRSGLARLGRLCGTRAPTWVDLDDVRRRRPDCRSSRIAARNRNRTTAPSAARFAATPATADALVPDLRRQLLIGVTNPASPRSEPSFEVIPPSRQLLSSRSGPAPLARAVASRRIACAATRPAGWCAAGVPGCAGRGIRLCCPGTSRRHRPGHPDRLTAAHATARHRR